MRVGPSAALSFVLFYGGHAYAQATATPAADPSAAAPQPAVAPSGLVQPSVVIVQQSLESVSVDRWKAPKALKETTTNNLGSIHRDLETTLPALLATADGAPGSLTGLIPVSQNLGALYDVLLRVTVVAESAAPAEQAAALQRGLTSLEGARRVFTERLQGAAEAQDRRITDLQTAVKARPAPAVVAAAPLPCKPTPAVKPKRKPAAKSANPSGN